MFWCDYRRFDYWLGLKLVYRWTDSDLMALNWTGWGEPLPDPLMCADLCATGDLNEVWRQENCASAKPFICEFPTGRSMLWGLHSLVPLTGYLTVNSYGSTRYVSSIDIKVTGVAFVWWSIYRIKHLSPFTMYKLFSRTLFICLFISPVF